MNFDLDYILQLAQNHEGVDIEFKGNHRAT